MDHTPSDQFLVFLRMHPQGETHEVVEVPLGQFDTYEEARRVRQAQLQAARDCVIRYVGPAGGGD
jgi:hypothetical protein